MGWAKYYEDNESIYIGRMVVRDTNPVYRDECEKRQVKIQSNIKQKSNPFSASVIRPEKHNGRRGLELVFQQGIEDSLIRNLQMNGWWWSKVNVCWCNLDTKGNRRYAEKLLRRGAKVFVVEEKSFLKDS